MPLQEGLGLGEGLGLLGFITVYLDRFQLEVLLLEKTHLNNMSQLGITTSIHSPCKAPPPGKLNKMLGLSTLTWDVSQVELGVFLALVAATLSTPSAVEVQP